ncbi:hypothetical protein [Micromonospora globbae]|uniref:Uncharacterized protein n=1 Tax=Micromonospora globbae TaxID=1894969 RepID=A0A420EVR9_9ACTN|nr:hypothetical protein [Micromonospora globbae]RKF24831.1 hypothetical protein D7I43_23530 [Micromonospora globbae]
MPKALPMTHTEDLHQRASVILGAALEHAATAVAVGDFTRAATAAQQLAQYAGHVQTAVVRDALAAGADWWQFGEFLGLHPQAAYEQYCGVAEGLHPPAQQQPRLAVVCTAGLVAEHDQDDEHGIDLDDLGDDHSLTQDPTVMRLRQAADLLDEDVWITVRLPGDYEGADDLDEGTAVRRWTTVVTHPDELGWLREALQLLAGTGREDIDDLEPL